MPKVKAEYNFFTKLRSHLRALYRSSPYRREAIKRLRLSPTEFKCAECQIVWPLQLADVDHEPPCGQLLKKDDLMPFIETLLHGNVQLLCKHKCHKAKTARQRRKHG